MQKKLLDDLFVKILNLTRVKDVAYHEVKDGKLNPIHKTQTLSLDVERWKVEHHKNPVYISHTPILQHIIQNKKAVAINDVKNDSRSESEFFFFGIQSILIVPVIKTGVIMGIVVVASIDKPHEFSENEIYNCISLVNDDKYNESVVKRENTAKSILRFLKTNDVDFIFGIPAGTVSPIFDAMNDVDIKPIITKNEGGAAYMAARYASVSNKLGVCIGAGGVGINNMINGIADAMRTKAPVLAISGYINRKNIGKGALQELDTEDILKPITKYSKTVLNEADTLMELENAIRLAMTPPYGPVHLSIPLDIQLYETERATFDRVKVPSSDFMECINDLDKAVSVISREKYGVIMVGKGCRGFSKEVMQLSNHLKWPIVTTPEGKGVVPGDFELNLGTYGFSSTDAAAQYVEKDFVTCVLIMGSSLGESATCNFTDGLVKGKKSIHVDRDIKELSKVFDTHVNVNCDIKEFIPYIINNTSKSTSIFKKPELNSEYITNHNGLSIRLFLEEITNILPKNTYYVSDLGEYMNFVFKYLKIPTGGDFEINLNYAAMGSGIAGAIGVHCASKGRPVAVFAGDGSFFMNGSEIITAKEYNMPIIYFIINNAMLGYVEHGHEFLFGRTVEGFKNKRVSISDLMKSLGIDTMQITKYEEIDKIKNAISNMNGPCVIELITDGSEKAPIHDRLKALK